MKNEALEKTIDYLKGEIEKLKESGEDFDKKSWGYEEGVLITGNEALTILKACEGQPDTDTGSGLHLADVNNCLPFGEWLFNNANPACLRNNKTNLWQLNNETINWNDRFKTTEELYKMYAKANCR